MATDGCETDLATSVGSCGACGIACSEVANGTPGCEGATCGARCTVPFQNCDSLVETGCESDAQSDAENCGACARQCPWPANSDFSCARSACAIACRPGYDNCDRMDANGCEVSLISSRNCGTCGRACEPGKVCARLAGAAPVCADRCPVGTTVCDGGCIDTQTEPNHCGTCGTNCGSCSNACTGTQVCGGGTCRAQCPTGFTDCDGVCREAQVDPRNCGACGTSCAAGQVCSAGMCVTECPMGQTSCAGACRDTRTSRQHCGACNNACASGPNGTAYCAAGQCRLRCAAGTGDCDGVGSNGCEQDVRSNPRACGVCDSGCAAGVACIDGQCDGMRCPPGRVDCDAIPTNGCEAEVRTDARNCGGCGASCAPASGVTNVSAACVAGRCNRTCTANRADCDGAGATPAWPCTATRPGK